MLELFESLLGDATGDQTKSKLELVGNYSFYVEPSIIGFQGYHSSTVVLTVFEDHSKKRPLEFSVKWSRIMNNETYEMENYREKHYHLTPSDIDLKVRAVITCESPKFPGAAYLYIGPVEIDRSLIPELEGMTMNAKGSFKTRIVARNNNPLKPNDSVIRIDRPYITINFDPNLEEEGLTEAEIAEFLPIEINFEMDRSFKVRCDTFSPTNVVIVHKNEIGRENRLVAQFETREKRDIFYIFLRLLRSLKSSFLEKLYNDYDLFCHAEWSPLIKELDDDEDDPEGEFSFYEMFLHDALREQLRKLLKGKFDLSLENLALADSLLVIENDLDYCSRQFRSLLEDGKNKSSKNLSKYEKSKSTLGETSFSVLEGVKKGGNKREATQQSNKTEIDSLERELKMQKEENLNIRKEIEALKQQPALEQTPPKNEDHRLVNLLLLSCKSRNQIKF